MCAISIKNQKGFTLLEIIVTLILISISAAVMFPVLGTNLVRSSEPVERLNDQHLLVQEMDRWTGIYRDEIRLNGTVNIAAFKVNVDTNANYLDSTTYINSFNGGAYNTQGTNTILRVILAQNDQTLVALFAQ